MISKFRWWLKDLPRNTKLKAESMLWHIRGGYVCIDCGTKTRFKNPQYEGTVNNRRMRLKNNVLNIPFGKSVCPHCIMRKVDAFFDENLIVENIADNPPGIQRDGRIWIRQCDFLRVNLPTVTGIRGTWTGTNSRLFLIIGAEWWNGFHASREAIRVCLTKTGVAIPDNYNTLKLAPQRVCDIEDGKL